MGIPAYFAFLIKNYPHLLTGAGRSGISRVPVYLFMDSNSIIYDAYYELVRAGSVITSELVIEKTVEKIEERIAFFGSLQKVYIAFDGVAPFAKMTQQRERRWKTAAAGAAGGGAWSTIQITPATEFMAALAARLYVWAAARPLVHMSCSDERGEGEHKLFRYVRENIPRGGAGATVVVYGLDADLIMLALNHVHLVAQMYVFRETAEFHAEDVAALREETYTLLDITALAAHISYYVGISPKEYILLCFFLGNDFMPHFPAICLRTTGMDFLLDVYAKLKKPLLRDDGEIHWKNLRLFVEMLARAERARMIEEDHTRDKMARRVAGFVATAKTEEEKTLHIPILRREIEKYICPQEDGWEVRYYRALFPHGGATADICARFLEGLEWTYKYYCGFCADWKWHYPYHYPPLLSDLYKYIPAGGMPPRHTFNAESMSPTQQLEFIMPPSTEIARGLVSREKNIVWAYCRYYWEAHLDFTTIAAH